MYDPIHYRPRSVVRADEGFDADDDPPWEGDDMYDDSGDEEGQLDGMRGRKKKIGRPIAYTGDPEDPRLTEAERRRIRRSLLHICHPCGCSDSLLLMMFQLD